jgi:shikimate kinase
LNTKSPYVMRLSLIGMAGSGKSYWSRKLAEHGFRRICCDDMIEAKLAPKLTRSDGTTMKLAEWMGFPYEPDYKRRESQYLSYEREVMSEILEYLENTPEENMVVDTTGSVIYTGEEILRRLQRFTTIVYLATPPGVQKQLLNAYISNPHPMLWRGIFSKEANETEEEALERCYPKLFLARKRLYQRYAEVTVAYYKRRKKGFGVDDFLRAVKRKKSQ